MSRFADLADHIRQHSKEIGASPRIGIDIPGLSEAFSLGDAFSSDTTTFTDEVTGSPAITLSASRLGGLSTIPSLQFSVSNQDLFSDLFASGGSPNPENEEVNVYLYFDDGTAILDAEREKLFSGIISDFPSLDYSHVEFQAESTDILAQQLIGTLITDSDAADTDKGLPEESQGKVRPIIYGDHVFNLGDDLRTSETGSTSNNLTPCLYLGVDSSGNHRWLVADHKVSEINAEGDDSEQQEIWGFDSTLGRFVRLFSTFTVEQNTEFGCIISHASAPQFYDHWYGLGTVTTAESESAPGRVTEFADEERVIDKDFTTASQGSLNESAQTGDNTTYTIPFPAYDDQNMDDADIIDIDYMWYADATVAGGAALGDGRLVVGGTSAVNHSLTADENTRVVSTASAFTKVNIALDVTFALDCVNALAAGESITLDTYQVYKRVRYTRNENLPLYFGGKGRVYGPWIQGRTTGETHADNNGEGNLIENGAGIVESLLRDEGVFSNILGSEILNEADFATVDKWDSTGDVNDVVGALQFVYNAGAGTLQGTATQTKANRAGLGENAVEYHLVYTVTVATAPDGDFALTLTDAFAESTTVLSFTAGAHDITFTSKATASAANFVINATESNSTQGNFSITVISLKPSLSLAVSFDESSLNIASKDLSTTKLSFVISDQVESNQIIDAILKTLGSVVYYNNEDQIRMRTFVSGDGFGVSGVGSPVAEDIWEFDPQQSFLVITGENDRFRYTDSDPAIYDIQITAGGYTGDGLAAAIETAMDAVSTPDMTCTYNSTTGKFTISDAGGNFTLTWDFFSASLADLLGFNSGVNNTGAASYTSTVPVWADSFIEHPIAEVNGFSLRKSQDPIITDVTVNYFLSPTTNAYQSTSNTSDVTKHAETIKGTFNNNYTRDQTTAEFHRDFLIARLFKKFYHGIINGPTANLSPIGVEGWDFVNLRHPVLNGILGSGEETQKWLLLRESLALKSLTMSIEAEQV
ncbi:hypothetical protein LCGC14_0428710 [marine sediment metagenome]|uniref:Uncharacterized protein n=1 Tax=marine sediment metagenome TaxID=412755 RepID=A0A0F9VAX6_9ZZZZ